MRRSLSAITIAVLGLAAVGCSGEDAAESILERAIESESGGEVDIDLGDLTDGGGFSIDTGEGSMTVDEDGNFVITDENGQVITGDVDVDGNGIDISSDDGNFSMESDDDGSVVIETDDGTMISGTASEVPEDWPSTVPEPTGFAIDSASQFSDGSTSNISVTGSSPDGAGWADAYSQALLAAGFSELSKLTTPESVMTGFEQGGMNVNVQAFDNGDGSWFIAVSVLSTGE